MSLLAQLIHLLPGENPDEDRDLDDEFDRITELTGALIHGADLTLVPELEGHLETFLEREDFYGRDVIGEVLAGIAGADALPVLLRASARDLGDDQDTFGMIICDLLEQDPARARPAVLDLVGADDGELRATGVWALDFILSDEDLPRVTAALGDPDPGVRSAAAGPAGRLARRFPEAMDAMAAALKDRDPQVRISVLSSLGYTKSAAAVPHVTRLRDDPDHRVREWAAIALNQLPG
ncbi:HEAT repeat domain-containing protein [Actinomadura sp. KC345]|uniref:HEAT repeat domain-containing protein n=1 Tax=Actinomadura sp. KC345 TaxID=2530371 RepID=UPI0014048FC6|nr:HEAT repeat domain-containing protein [Actinomadura sp. KC345]